MAVNVSPGVTMPAIPSSGCFGYPNTDDILVYDPTTHTGTGIVSGAFVTMAETVSFAAVGSTVYLVDTTVGNLTATLPVPANGKQVVIKKVDSSANTVTVLPHAAETIDGASSYSNSTQYQSNTFISDGTNWWNI